MLVGAVVAGTVGAVVEAMVAIGAGDCPAVADELKVTVRTYVAVRC